MDLTRVEVELKKRLSYPYRWGRKQSNSWDAQSNLIYTTYSMASLLAKTEQFDEALRDYTLNRWYNFWSAKAVEDIFCSFDGIEAYRNQYDKLVDFTIEGIPFDHKSTVFPKGFQKTLEYAQNHEYKLIEWLYNNQSQEGRKHLKNRLFVVLYDAQTLQHWRLKAEISLLRDSVEEYVSNFSPKQLHVLDFGDGAVYADIIWVNNKGES